MKEHPTVLVKGVGSTEVHDSIERRSPFRTWFEHPKAASEYPRKSKLLPDSFIVIEHPAVAVKAGSDPAMLKIDSVIDPEWNNFVDKSI